MTASELSEACLLGSMLLNGEALAGALDQLSAEDFQRDAHRTLFATMQQLHDDGSPVDTITVTVALIDAHQLDHVGGAVAVSDLIAPEVCPAPAAWAYHVDVIRREARRARGIDRLSRAIRELQDGADPDDVITRLRIAA